MSKESIQQKGPQVKRKGGLPVAKKTRRVSHTVEEGFAITIREFTRGMAPGCVGKTRRGRINNSAYHIKKAALAWADAFPKKINGVPTGFTPAVRDVFKAVVWSHLMDRGYAVFSYDTLADTARCHRDTAREAVNFLRARGLLQWKTGKGWGRKERRSLANQYTANFWAFINPETGTIINPPYHTGTYEWKVTASRFRARLKAGPYTEIPPMVAKRDVDSSGVGEKAGPYTEIPPMVKGNKRHNHAEPYTEIPPLYSDNGKGGASLPASADATASAAPPEKEIGPLPEHDSDSVKVRYARLDELALRSGIDSNGLINLFAGKGTPSAMIGLQGICKRQIFNYGKPTFGTLDHDPPTNGVKVGRVIVYEGMGRVSFVEDGLALTDLTPDSRLVIEYRVSPEYQTEAAAKVAALKVGI